MNTKASEQKRRGDTYLVSYSTSTWYAYISDLRTRRRGRRNCVPGVGKSLRTVQRERDGSTTNHSPRDRSEQQHGKVGKRLGRKTRNTHLPGNQDRTNKLKPNFDPSTQHSQIPQCNKNEPWSASRTTLPRSATPLARGSSTPPSPPDSQQRRVG